MSQFPSVNMFEYHLGTQPVIRAPDKLLAASAVK